MKTDRKSFVWNIIGNTLNAMVSLTLMIIVTRINGEDNAGVYAFAFSVALVFYCIGIYYGRVYQVSDVSDCTDGDFFISKTVTCLSMLAVAVGFVLLKHYDLFKCGCILLFCIFKCMEAFSESVYSIIQRNNELYKVGISFTIKSVAVTGIFLVVDLLTYNLLLSAVGIVVGYLLVFIIYDLKNLKRVDMDLSSKRSRRVFLYKDGFYPFAITFLSLYIINASKYAIDLRLRNIDQTIYGIIIMPSTAILLFVQYVLHPYVRRISHLYKDGAYSDIRGIVCKQAFAVIGVSAAGVTMAITIGIPVLEFIYGVRLHDYKLHLVIIMLGAGMFGIANILSNVLVAIRKNRVQFVILLLLAVTAFVLSDLLTVRYDLLGAAVSYTLVMLVACVIFTALMFIQLNKVD